MKRTKTLSAMSFAAYDVERRTRKGSFYAQVDTIIDWNPISAIIDLSSVVVLCFFVKSYAKLKF
ncbi:hypothetical protein [Capnocytophaga canimorsus]|uniref:hypothetical protein n=1 Tax=Capnocytophaga canimorsus TaxID=28188 RepID=UPI001EDFE451|nr:hypothetical protein [Capnocytophaga canimorsus]